MSKRTAFFVAIAGACISTLVFALWWARQTSEPYQSHLDPVLRGDRSKPVPFPATIAGAARALTGAVAPTSFDDTIDPRLASAIASDPEPAPPSTRTPRSALRDGASTPAAADELKQPAFDAERPEVEAAGGPLPPGYEYGLVAGRKTILTSGRRIDEPDIYVPDDAMQLVASAETLRARVCVDEGGRPDRVDIVDGTGVARVDAYVEAGLADGRYRPLRIGGERVPFCERVTVVVKP